MKLGIVLPLFSGDTEKVLAAAGEAERLDFDGVFVFDHLFPPGAPPDRPSLEAFTTLAAVAEVTERITVGTLVARVGLRPVGLLAKMASWVDHASAGRLVLGLGTGDPIDRPEHRAFGMAMPGKRERRAHLEEAVTALKALFAGEAYPGGSHVPPIEGPLAPTSPRPDGPPMWIGGQADEVARIAARVADGWNGWGMDTESFEAKAAVVREEARAAGREVEATWAGIVLAGVDREEAEELAERRRARGLEEAWTGTAEELVAFLGGLEAAGGTWAVAVLAGPPDRGALVAERVLPAIRAGVGERTRPGTEGGRGTEPPDIL
jgi:alkanesulfonate monooxygenase SsuD/methylene tetrahydromethanopterin reductase-like flavin-dependent oxidoreductase (luciferase family)